MALLKLLLCLFLLIVFIAGLLFSFRNQALIDVDLLFFHSSSFSVGFWLLTSLITGFILGMFISFPKRLYQNIKIHQLSKKISEKKMPLAQIMHEPNKGN